MNEQQLRGLIDEVKSGKLPRRGFIQQMVGLGLTRADGVDDADACRRGPGADRRCRAYKPTKRGGGGTLKLLWWQAAGAR